MKQKIIIIITFLLTVNVVVFTQSESDDLWNDEKFKGLEMRSIGPAFMAGRIADIAIHPKHENTWYVAVASGGVWKTTNAGTTWDPVFDEENVFAIGCVTIDANNPDIIWVGTGENVGGRHLSYGDGVYKSIDAGKTWKNMGLAESRHISKIIVHPDNSDIIWLASQGPLWSSGGDRGLYKSTDGGLNWDLVLKDNEWTGATDIQIDPRNPDILYVATWQRHRTIAAYLGGGKGSGIHRSDDGGSTWKKLSSGLPESNMGKIGLAISPQKPNHIYAAIELNQRTGGVYKSYDRGESWTKQSDAVAGATGPHYYQELYACPHHYDRLYLVDNKMQISDDGGINFRLMNEKNKHVDNHSVTFKSDDPDYLLVGTDGGVYESFDLAKSWRFVENMPITQFYKLAVDDSKPFYNIYGGTQDNSTECGPSRTDNVQGIQNSDWSVVLNWDGHQPATEPGNPNIAYGQRQEGNLARIDTRTGEVTDIQPQPGKGETAERFNWDAPIFVSPHSPTRLYFGSQRLWKSDNRGDSWDCISDDLTKNLNRIELPIMGKKHSVDNAWDLSAMSNYNTITSISESPIKEGLLYIGTDDGLFQISENDGDSWTSLDLGTIANIPSNIYINDIKADIHNINNVYMALDNHKHGDLKPYLLKSADKGKTWNSMLGNLPEQTIVWRIVQDPINPKLFFIGTEFGLYFTINKGKQWTKITGGLPTISFRDLVIQKREDDLVAASFGRSFYIYDDIKVFREISDSILNGEAHLFSLRDAWRYIPRSHLDFEAGKGTQGTDHYIAENPEFGASFTYYLKEDYHTRKQLRQKAEKDLGSNDKDIPFPGWEELAKEDDENETQVYIKVYDEKGQLVNTVMGSNKSGFHKISWNLRFPSSSADNSETLASGILAQLGNYYGVLYKNIDGVETKLSDAENFKVKPLHQNSIANPLADKTESFWNKYAELVQKSSALNMAFSDLEERSSNLKMKFIKSKISNTENIDKMYRVDSAVNSLKQNIYGNSTKLRIGEKTEPLISERIFSLSKVLSNSTYGPTETALQTINIIESTIDETIYKVNSLNKDIDTLADLLYSSGGPLIKGSKIPKN